MKQNPLGNVAPLTEPSASKRIAISYFVALAGTSIKAGIAGGVAVSPDVRRAAESNSDVVMAAITDSMVEAFPNVDVKVVENALAESLIEISKIAIDHMSELMTLFAAGTPNQAGEPFIEKTRQVNWLAAEAGYEAFIRGIQR